MDPGGEHREGREVHRVIVAGHRGGTTAEVRPTSRSGVAPEGDDRVTVIVRAVIVRASGTVGIVRRALVVTEEDPGDRAVREVQVEWVGGREVLVDPVGRAVGRTCPLLARPSLRQGGTTASAAASARR